MIFPGPTVHSLALSARGTRAGPVAGAALWLRADRGVLDADGNAAADGAAVATWRGCGGSAADAAQAAPASRPTFRAAVLNGKPVVRFAGANLLSTPPVAMNGPTATTFIVARPTAVPATRQVVLEFGPDTRSTAGTWVHYYCDSTLRTDLQDLYEVSNIVLPAWHLLSAVMDRTAVAEAVQHVNGTAGTADAAGANSGNFGANAFFVGARAGFALPFTGDVAEILVYPSALSDTDRGVVESYLNGKYGIY